MCSSEFALRSYLYLLLHAVVGGPLMLLSSLGITKVRAQMRISVSFLGLLPVSCRKIVDKEYRLLVKITILLYDGRAHCRYKCSTRSDLPWDYSQLLLRRL